MDEPKQRYAIGGKDVSKEAWWRADSEIKHAKWRNERILREAMAAMDASALDDYGQGFVDGYLRAHADGQEYACTVRQAMNAYAEFTAAGERGQPRQDVEGW